MRVQWVEIDVLVNGVWFAHVMTAAEYIHWCESLSGLLLQVDCRVSDADVDMDTEDMCLVKAGTVFPSLEKLGE